MAEQPTQSGAPETLSARAGLPQLIRSRSPIRDRSVPSPFLLRRLVSHASGVSFEIFVQRFVEGDEADGGNAEARCVLDPYLVRADDQHPTWWNGA